MPELFNLRDDIIPGTIEEGQIPTNPFVLFQEWMSLAIKNDISNPNAMVLATCSLNNKPSSRVVLLKYYDQNGFVFFTNYESRKGKELMKNPAASIVFYWAILQKQIRIEGLVTKVTTEISDNYFEKRPLDSQISASVSPQSKIIPNRKKLELLFKKTKKNKKKLKRPDHWGGYCLKPDLFEFWQGRSTRLHDRIFYEQVNDQWKVGRLAP